MRWLKTLVAACLFALVGQAPAAIECTCRLDDAVSMRVRQCALCAVAEREPGQAEFFVVHDASPNKPNRWLALPRFHLPGFHLLNAMTDQQRTDYWTIAIAKANELWGDQWALAYNGPDARSQCHTHIHIGKLLDGFENGEAVVVSSPSEIPAPIEGYGLLVHPVGGGLHVHTGSKSPELALMP